MQILGFPESMTGARALAAARGAEIAAIDLHGFPDGESRVRLPPSLPESVVFFRSLNHPNEKLVELLLAAETARELGARDLTLVAPYLCYMRQDTAFAGGEAVSARIIGRYLAGLFDSVITVDPHLHRLRELVEAVPARRVLALSAAAAAGTFLAAESERPLLVGPDEESAQWVRTVAREASLDWIVARKKRRGDRDVFVELPDRDYAGCQALLVDDIASSGRTLATAARLLFQAGARQVDVLVTHALFAGDALEVIQRAGVRRIWSSDSVVHPTNAFSLTPLLAEALVPVGYSG